jgi:hypothetical protein
MYGLRTFQEAFTMKCSKCGAENEGAFQFCGVCGTPLSVPQQPEPPHVNKLVAAAKQNPVDAQAVLYPRLLAYLNAGYHVVFRDESSIQLVRQKSLGGLASAMGVLSVIGWPVSLAFSSVPSLAFLGFLASGLCSILFFLGLIVYLHARDECAFLYVDAGDNVREIVK